MFSGLLRKRIIVIVIALTLFTWAILMALSYVGKSHNITLLDTKRQAAYEVDKSYDIGTTIDCRTSSYTNFGQVVVHTSCDLIKAKLYIPRIITSTSTSSNGMQADAVTPVGKNGEPIKLFDDWEKDSVKGGRIDTVELTPAYSDSNRVVAGKYDWYDYDSAHNTQRDKLVQKIAAKIKSDQPLAKGAPTVSQALTQNQAPEVVYYTYTVCSSFKIPLIDHLCLIPNL